jgi:hypothetical protein
VARLSVIADSVSALQDMQEITLEEFIAHFAHFRGPG